jgi:hypothetical protein
MGNTREALDLTFSMNWVSPKTNKVLNALRSEVSESFVSNDRCSIALDMFSDLLITSSESSFKHSRSLMSSSKFQVETFFCKFAIISTSLKT